jgi:hypothetical protein
MFKWADLRVYADPYVARFSPVDVIIPDGGWHFTFMGDVKRIQNKLRSWSHQEYNNDRFNTKEYIQYVISHGDDILGRKIHFNIMPSSFLPKEVQENPSRYASLLLETAPKTSVLYDLALGFKRNLRILFRKACRMFKEL